MLCRVSMEEGQGKKQVRGMGKSKEGKPPTRLQMHAPASLVLDQVKPTFGTSKAPPPPAAAATPIPLLTPVASPNLFPQTHEFVFPAAAVATSIPLLAPVASPNLFPQTHEFVFPTPVPTTFAWKEPAGAAHVEVSTMLALFQNRCVIVNDAQ